MFIVRLRLFSHFIPCRLWEAVYILAPRVGLAYLQRIELMSRIRNWKDLTLFKSSKDLPYQHIEELFDDAIDWQLIETHLPDMLRVVLSIRVGRIAPATILRKLGNYSRKNRPYQAFRELGRVVRTAFLLRYVSDLELRRLIQAATNRSEAFNPFVQWLFFGGEKLIAGNVRDRVVKYNDLVANCVIFHNVNTQTRILRQLVEEEGYALVRFRGACAPEPVHNRARESVRHLHSEPGSGDASAGLFPAASTRTDESRV